MINNPDLWLQSFPVPSLDGHKYDRGAAVIYGAPKLTGATRLAACSCARLCGVTSVVAPLEARDIYRTTLPAHIMVKDIGQEDLSFYAQDTRNKAVLLGCGGGYDDSQFIELAQELSQMKHLNGIVLDAEAIKAWSGDIELFSRKMSPHTIITPHEGEFSFLFRKHPEILAGSREECALRAALKLKSIVILKGAKTIITDGARCVINDCAPSELATAGSGDVLAGVIVGLLASGMPEFEAACAGVWMHAQAALKLGAGLVSSDLSDQIPNVLKDLLGIRLKVR